MNHVGKVSLRSVGAADMEPIRELLARSGLPTSDLSTARPEFIVACDGERIIGTGALEHFGIVALLRSVAVEPFRRSSGMGRRIVGELEQRARSAGVKDLVLLTLTAQDFFARHGYVIKKRSEVPAAVLSSAEFRSLCPASAVCMAKGLDQTVAATARS